MPSANPAARFSIVSAIYNVDRYLEDFLTSLERQSIGMKNLDVILVDDGSTDGSFATIQTFAEKHPGSVRAFTKNNGGQGSARNFGLDHARGEWVCFADPDDFLNDDYFERVTDYLSLLTQEDKFVPQVLATTLVSFDESTGMKAADHAMQRKFGFGSRVIDLDVEADAVQMHCNCALFRLSVINEFSLRFDERIRPTFEDVSFVSNYFLSVESPLLGLVSEAEYFYRNRADQSSAIATSTADPGRYTAVPRYGLLGVLENSMRVKGSVPDWLQNAVLYNVAWAMKDDTAVKSATGSISDGVRNEFHALMTEVMSYISDNVILSFSLTALNDDLRFALFNGYGDRPALETRISHGKYDEKQGLVQLRYRYSGSAPLEEFYTDGVLVSPLHQKRRAIIYHGRILAYERIVWVPVGDRLKARLNGKTALIGNETARAFSTIERHVHESKVTRAINLRPEHVRWPAESLISRSAMRMTKIRDAVSKSKLRQTAGRTVMSSALHSSATRRAFGNAWVFMDKDVLAGDNAEYLYRYVTENHPEINAWFVLNENSADWKRLKADGFRLVAYGSFRWRLLMLSAVQFASSHIDEYVINPFNGKYGAPTWRFTFLQHGVIKDDLSRWLNGKALDLFVTASPAEYDSIVADDTPYPFTGREVKLTGLPRHDALKARRERVNPDERDLILIMPTWRKSLVGTQVTTVNDRSKVDGFMETTYARQYTELLNSPRLLDFARTHSLKIAFMPHPNMVRYLADFDLPGEIEVHSYETSEVQDLLARGRVFVTDYSSMAFNAAAIDLPTAYFQFDQEEFYKGDHVGRKGYFDYERDGFGPVCLTLSDVEDAIIELFTPSTDGIDYSQRMHDTFKYHDKGNSQRVFDAMLALDEPAV